MAQKKKTKDITNENVLNVEKENLKKSTLPEESLENAESATIEPEELDKDRIKEQTKDVGTVNETNPTDDEYEKELRRFLIPKLRSASYRWHYRSEAIRKARKERGIYTCAICGIDMKNKEYAVDHVEPVVPLEGWNGTDYNTYIRRMLVKTEGWQIICHSCHDIKTDTETQIRKLHREKKKKGS